MHKKRKVALGFLGLLVVAIVAARVWLPGYVLKRTNAYLDTISPLYGLHIGEVDIDLFRMAYSGKNVRGYLKKTKTQNTFDFLQVQEVDTSLAWRELFRGRFVADVKIKNANLKITTASIKAVAGYSADQVKSDAQKAKDATIPFNLQRLRLIQSTLLFSDLEKLPPEQGFRLTKVDATANNLTPSDDSGVAVFAGTATAQERSQLKITGQFYPNRSPLEWSFTSELQQFPLTSVNPLALRMIPFTFKSGVLNAYASVHSNNGKIRGYVKPFFRKLSIVGDSKDFQNSKQFFFEVAGVLGNFILKNRESKAVAMKIAFRTQNGVLKIDTGKAIASTLENAFSDPLPPGVDESSVSIEAKQAAATVGASHVAEVQFKSKAYDLTDAEFRRLEQTLQKAGSLERLTLVVWGDSGRSQESLAFARAENLRRRIEMQYPDLDISTMNMSEPTDKLDKFLQTEKYRVQRSFRVSAVKKHSGSAKAIVIIFTKQDG